MAELQEGLFAFAGVSKAEMAKKTLREATFAFLDTETTGISVIGGARVCELAILKVRGSVPVESFSSLINPDCPIDPGAQRVHGISDEMVRGSPRFGQLAPKVQELLQSSVMVCHNAPFDVGFMNEEFRRAGLGMPDIHVVDTLPLARKHFKFGRNNLAHIATQLGLAPEGWHRAGNDVKLLSRIFEHFIDHFTRKGVRTLADLLKQ